MYVYTYGASQIMQSQSFVTSVKMLKRSARKEFKELASSPLLRSLPTTTLSFVLPAHEYS